MAEFRLHCFAQSGASYRVALMLALCGADWEPVFVDFFHGETRGAPFRALNVMGEAPVLEHGDLRLSQSGVILDYLSEALGRFAPEDPAARREVLRWMLWDNHKLNGPLATARFMRTFTPPETRSAEVIGFLLGRARTALGVLDAHLAGRDWIVGAAPSAADLSCIAYLYYDGELGLDLAEFPQVDRWRKALAALPGWRHPYELMPGHPLPAPARPPA